MRQTKPKMVFALTFKRLTSKRQTIESTKLLKSGVIKMDVVVKKPISSKTSFAFSVFFVCVMDHLRYTKLVCYKCALTRNVQLYKHVFGKFPSKV